MTATKKKNTFTTCIESLNDEACLLLTPAFWNRIIHGEERHSSMVCDRMTCRKIGKVFGMIGLDLCHLACSAQSRRFLGVDWAAIEWNGRRFALFNVPAWHSPFDRFFLLNFGACTAT